jgi:hypothetical protein
VEPCDHRHYLVPKHFHHSKQKPYYTHEQSLPSPLPTAPATMDLLPVSVDLLTAGISQRGITQHIGFGVYLLSSMLWHVSEFHPSSWPSNIPLNRHITLSLCTPQLTDMGSFYLLAVKHNTARNLCTNPCGRMFSFLLGTYLGVELLGHMVTMFTLLRNCHLFLKWPPKVPRSHAIQWS